MVGSSDTLRDDAPDAISVANIGVNFGGVRALDGVSLSIRPGEVLGLIGPNGSGKTTLFDVISGLRRPQSGSVCLAGHDVTNKSAVLRARSGLSRTFQSVQTFGWLTVEENVLSALDWTGGGGGFLGDLIALPPRRRRERERRDRVRDALARCGLTDIATTPAASLPIGLARMVELARATADIPSILLLDEPISGLDSQEASRLAGQISVL